MTILNINHIFKAHLNFATLKYAFYIFLFATPCGLRFKKPESLSHLFVLLNCAIIVIINLYCSCCSIYILEFLNISPSNIFS